MKCARYETLEDCLGKDIVPSIPNEWRQKESITVLSSSLPGLKSIVPLFQQFTFHIPFQEYNLFYYQPNEHVKPRLILHCVVNSVYLEVHDVSWLEKQKSTYPTWLAKGYLMKRDGDQWILWIGSTWLLCPVPFSESQTHWIRHVPTNDSEMFPWPTNIQCTTLSDSITWNLPRNIKESPLCMLPYPCLPMYQWSRKEIFSTLLQQLNLSQPIKGYLFFKNGKDGNQIYWKSLTSSSVPPSVTPVVKEKETIPPTSTNSKIPMKEKEHPIVLNITQMVDRDDSEIEQMVQSMIEKDISNQSHLLFSKAMECMILVVHKETDQYEMIPNKKMNPAFKNSLSISSTEMARYMRSKCKENGCKQKVKVCPNTILQTWELVQVL
jgi:hypothetical protein